MERGKWYLSTWFISGLFTLWFLIIPLIFGIIFLLKQKKEIQIREDNFKKTEEFIEFRLKELNDKKEQQESMFKDLENDHKKKLILITKKREDELNEYERILELKSKELIRKQDNEKRKIHVLRLAQLLTLLSWTKRMEQDLLIKEEEINTRQREIEMKETVISESIKSKKNIIDQLNAEIYKNEQKALLLKQNLIRLNDEELYQSLGFYETRFDLENSDEYKYFLDKVRKKQKELVKEERATIQSFTYFEESEISNNKKLNKQLAKIAIRSFNNDCDSIIGKVKFNNVEASELKIRAAFYQINKLNRYSTFELSQEYLSLKLEELFLAYEFAQKKQEEREEQKRINELIREERRVQEELEKELEKLKKEERHLENVIRNSSKLSEVQIITFNERLDQIKRQREDVDYRVKNIKAGYVYVISNIGSFGENVYKIGMTRRLDPMDRVRELGGASVPFRYDVHAIIFSEDAPQLEASLHRTFSHRRVNKVNERKEFFNVSLAQIKKVVTKNCNAVIEFTMLTEAKEYRETKAIEERMERQDII